MIKPIFFPFTHLQKTDIRAISAVFQSIFFFPASTPDEFEKSVGPIENQDFILPIYTENNDFEPVLRKVNEYRNWGELNKDNRGNLKAFLQDKPYFTNETYVPHLRANIERLSQKSDDLPSEKDTLFNNLMFVRLAKLHDLEKENLDDQFIGVAEDEKKLFSAIRGDDQKSDQKDTFTDIIATTPLKTQKDDLGEYMTSQRISAWVDFFNKKKPFNSFDSSLLFVTTSLAVMEYLLSISKNKIKLLDIDNLKVHEKKCENKNQWVDSFNKYVENLVTSGQQSLDTPAERDDNCTLGIKIKLYLLQGDVISNFFQGVGKKIPVCFLSV